MVGHRTLQTNRNLRLSKSMQPRRRRLRNPPRKPTRIQRRPLRHANGRRPPPNRPPTELWARAERTESVLKTCLGCGARYAWTLAQCPQDGSTSFLESGQAVTITDPASTATTGTLTVGHAAQVNTLSADATRALPSATSAGAAAACIAYKVDSSAHTLTITPSGSDTVDGGASYILTGAGGAEFRSDGAAGWFVSRLVIPDPLLLSIYLPRAEVSRAASSSAAAMAVVLGS